MQLLKEASIKSHGAWKSAGKPRNGPVFWNDNGAECGIERAFEKIIILKLRVIGLLMICTRPY